MKELPFVKMQGLGNDFVILDDVSHGGGAQISLPTSLAKQVCDRRFGVGADQILWLKQPHDKACDVRMEIVNSDGSIGEMCGNGVRAVALFLNRYGIEKKLEYRVETLGGIQKVQIHGSNVLVDMGIPKLGAGFPQEGELIRLKDRELRFFEVNVGNPHAIFFVDNVGRFPVEEVGPLVETHRRFPNRTNVEFIEVRSPTSIKVRVWERGAGITLACGSGACAAAVACVALKKTEPMMDVQLPGGKLKIGWNGPSTSVMMEGPAQEVFKGIYFY